VPLVVISVTISILLVLQIDNIQQSAVQTKTFYSESERGNGTAGLTPRTQFASIDSSLKHRSPFSTGHDDKNTVPIHVRVRVRVSSHCFLK
jgi:hypothetical protein